MEIFWVIIIIFIVWSIASGDKDGVGATDVRFRKHKHKHPDGSTVLKHKHDAPVGTTWHRHDVDGTVIPTYEDGSPISPTPAVQPSAQQPVSDPDWHWHPTRDGQIMWHSHPAVPGHKVHYHRADGGAVGGYAEWQTKGTTDYGADVIDVRRNDDEDP